MKSLLLLTLLSINTYSQAQEETHQCDITLTKGVKVGPSNIQIIADNQVAYQISNDGHVVLGHDKLTLTTEQQKQAQQFEQKIRQAVPQSINLVESTIQLVSGGLEMSEVLGKDTKLYEILRQVLTQIEKSANEAISHSDSGETYSIDPTGIEQMKNTFSDSFEQDIEAALEDSIGSIFSLAFDAMFSDPEAFEKKMTALGKSMEEHGSSIELLAEQLCNDLIQLDKLEQAMLIQIPQLSSFDMLTLAP